METVARPSFGALKTDADFPALRTPPHNFEAEMALLGALLFNNKAFERVAEFLRPEHFADPRHARIFEACGKLIERGATANAVTLKSYFEQDNSLVEVGGVAYLARLAGAVVTVINAVDYAKIVYDHYIRRQLIAIGEDVVNDAYKFDLESEAAQQIQTAEQKLFDLAKSGEYGGGFKRFGEALAGAIDMAEAAYKRDSHVTGVTTGLIDLDKKLGGMHPSDLIILAGRPSMGKTALATKWAFSAAEAYKERKLPDGTVEVVEGAKVAFFSLEMSAEQLATRLLSEVTEIPSEKIRRGEISGEDFPKFVEASKRLSNLNLFIDDTPALSITALRTRARRLQRTHGLGMIVVDYLQLVAPPPGIRSENRVQEISAITRGLKAIAKELDVPVIALSQLSRAVEQREDKRPQLADLRESGSIEQDADVVMFVFREEYYLGRQEPSPGTAEHEQWQADMERVHGVAEVIIGKQRHGPIGIVKVAFDGAYTRFSNLAQPDHYPDGD